MRMRSHLPSVCWGACLVALYFMDASSDVSLCLSKLLGLGSCPGCGLGHAVHEVLHFRLASSFDYHPLGLPVTLALGWLAVKPLFTKHTPYEPTTTDDPGPSAR